MKEYRPRRGTIPTLPVPELRGIRSAHLVGIGGVGMSGLARLLLARGIAVSGSDLKESRVVLELRSVGAVVRVGHRRDHVEAPDVVVVSTAIPEDNVELVAARQRGISVHARAQILAALMREHRGIAVGGTHGKTTTTSMLGVLLERAGLDPTYLVGGELNESGSNARSGKGDLFVAEADESDGSFLLLSPDIAIVTNVEPDHLDFYEDAEDVEAAFVAFGERAGRLVACGDDAGVRRVLARVSRPALLYGEADASDVRIEDVSLTGAESSCSVALGSRSARLTIPFPGRHSLVNAAGAIAAATLVDISLDDAVGALNGFGGVRRRFERRGLAGGVEFVDDYAHHPTEIAATLAAARADGGRRVVAVFQPHRYSRTAAMWRALGESLAGADVVVLTDVYGAGESPVPGVTGKLLVDALLEAAPGKRAAYLPRRSEVAAYLARHVREGDLVLTLGAGDITMVGDETMALVRRGDTG